MVLLRYHVLVLILVGLSQAFHSFFYKSIQGNNMPRSVRLDKMNLHLNTQSAPIIYSSVPLKTMIFIDGTWLYYTIIVGRGDKCPIRKKFGSDWLLSRKVDYNKLVNLIGTYLEQQIAEQRNQMRQVDMVRTCVFTGSRETTSEKSERSSTISDYQSAGFEVHQFTHREEDEKCVDISLAVEMLYMATVADAYDIACILTGDKDFIPAMQKTRLLGKRVNLVSMRNSCNRDLTLPELNIRDFEVMWLEDHIDEFIIPRITDDDTEGLVTIVKQLLQLTPGGILTIRELGKQLQGSTVNRKNALKLLKEGFENLSGFLNEYSDEFTTVCNVWNMTESGVAYTVTYANNTEATAEKHLAKLKESSDAENDLNSKTHWIGSNKSGLDWKGGALTSKDLTLSLADQDIEELMQQQGLRFSKDRTAMMQLLLDNGNDDNTSEFDEIPAEIVKSLPRLGTRVNLAEKFENSHPKVFAFLKVFLKNNDMVSSRDLGRFLQGEDEGDMTALALVKSVFGSLKVFVTSYPEKYMWTSSSTGDKERDWEFMVGLTEQERDMNLNKELSSSEQNVADDSHHVNAPAVVIVEATTSIAETNLEVKGTSRKVSVKRKAAAVTNDAGIDEELPRLRSRTTSAAEVQKKVPSKPGRKKKQEVLVIASEEESE